MAATTFDKVLPPVVFVVALLTCFLVIVIAMNPTIESNLQSNHNAPTPNQATDYEKTVFKNQSIAWLDPNPMTITSADRVTDWPASADSQAKVFTNTIESGADIKMIVIGKHLGDYGGDRHQLYFKQTGGMLGEKHFYCGVNYPDDWVATSLNANGTIITSFASEPVLAHVYIVYVTPGPGSSDALASFLSYNYNISIGFNTTQHMQLDVVALIWGLFTFSLPGVPFFIEALIMTPIMATIAFTIYFVARSALPW